MRKNIYLYANTAPFLQQIQSIKKVEGSWYDFPGILRVGYIFDTHHKLLMTLHFVYFIYVFIFLQRQSLTLNLCLPL